ncbi:hypothetical protein GCM10012290_17710 [Halolactibacillus alkaliphilus]|uniref:Periplasmic binding protein domain-containing protein n=1 Tax=Halolactibacillus alkaliphilus TaxID=442899 RepID=A0A511X2F3_9BACI|nr:substrate-binding domain-containing protein [Halolactibacillus alkaliphilus]GEN57126.1 hypothetical protein HAL01_15900 [Halolactibacillus alkaliphilus]GGN72085.1 hypothetical protein GCM10012290_17710 [Halolactibacillus alkaliphilus]SFO87909.1 ribose transport system substrate-binding protein [Halolactibacillus alkaliphilus]
MRKIVTALFIGAISITALLTLRAFVDVMFYDIDLPRNEDTYKTKQRLVLITDQMGTPFFDAVIKGAMTEANERDVTLEVLGYQNQNEEALFNDLERSIYAKVDGIIVQGKDTEVFKELTKVKAAFYSIPVVTIAEDVPIEESLRRTYVGSNHYKMGQTLAHVVTEDYKRSETIVVYYDETMPYYQQERLRGVEEVFAATALEIIKVPLPPSIDEAVLHTQTALNKYPSFDAVVMLDATLSPVVMNEIKRRRQIEPLGIYTFDEQRDLNELLANGEIDALIKQSPEKMGALSVEVLSEWINNERDYLEFAGYLTPFSVERGESHAQN